MKKTKILKNTSMLLAFNIAKMVFPLITLPYLTRVLSTDIYGTVAYVKAVMSYMQIIVDFGFILSATKDVVIAKNDKHSLEIIIGDTMLARVIMGIVALALLIILIISLPILRKCFLFTLLSYGVVFASIFLMDFLFRGLEIMHIITIRFILMKVISTILTLIFVKNDSDILLIPIFDILGSLIAVILVIHEFKKLELSLQFSGIKNALIKIKESFVYFLSEASSTSFNTINTLIIGIRISATEVAYWSVCMQIMGAAQSVYNPISNGIYPEMIKSKDINLIKRVLIIFMPIIILGSVIAYFSAGIGMMILGGVKYLPATKVFRYLIPVIVFAFPSMIVGWPALGAINKAKEVTTSTVIAIIFNILLIIYLIVTNTFTLINIAIARTLTELIMLVIRMFYVIKYRKLFISTKKSAD